MTPRKTLLALCAFFCLTLTSCFEVVSNNPLSDPKRAKVDERLIGTWEHKVNDQLLVVEIARHPRAGKGDPPIAAGMMIAKLTDFDNKKGEVPFFVTTIGKETFYNVDYSLEPRKDKELPEKDK
jgi:hypothetical protein